MSLEQDVLIDEIIRRVKEKLGEGETEPVAVRCDAPSDRCSAEQPKAKTDKHRILILSREHTSACHSVLQSEELQKYFSVECASMLGDFCVKEFEAVVAFGLDIEDLGKIADGILDDDYRRTLGMALLFGKKVFMPKERVKLINLGSVAPTPYYRSLEDKLRTLKNSGLTLVPEATLEQAVVAGVPHDVKFSPAAFSGGYEPLAKLAAQAQQEEPAVGGTMDYAKRVLTESVVKAAAKEGIAEIRIGECAIVTDLAKDYAARFRVRLVREKA